MGRSLLLFSTLLAASAVAGPRAAGPRADQPPRGVRTPRPVATHVVLTKTTLRNGAVVATLKAGAQVRVARPSLTPLRGRLPASTLGAVSVRGTVDANALGLFVRADTDLKLVSGKGVLGKARAGGMVRVIPGKTIKGHVLVETVGSVVAKALIEVAALSPHGDELVLVGDYGLVALGAVKLMKEPSPDSTALATLSPYAKLTPLDHTSTYYKVRTFGAFAVEGYVDQGDLVPRAEFQPRPVEPSLLRPTHEVFVRSPIYARPNVRRLGFASGGTLVERVPGKATKNMVRVHTVGAVVVSGWISESDLRPLEKSVWQEKKP